jgi:hypothetical protein
LDGVSGQRAAITDEEAQERKLIRAQIVAIRTWKLARHREVIARLKVIQSMPTVDRQELVVGGRPNGAPKLRCQAEHPLAPSREDALHCAWLKLPSLGINSEHLEA